MTLTLLVLLVDDSVEVEAVDERAHGLAGRVSDQAFVEHFLHKHEQTE